MHSDWLNLSYELQHPITVLYFSVEKYMFGHFLMCITYPWDPAHKIIKQMSSIHYLPYDLSFPRRCSQKEATKHIPNKWVMPRGRAEGKATLWPRVPAIKAKGSGDQGWVRFWVFSGAKLDFVQKFLDWHLEHFSPKHKCWLEQHLNIGNYSKSRLRIRSEFY